jgi:type II secretory pathway pseudopilin PulG
MVTAIVAAKRAAALTAMKSDARSLAVILESYRSRHGVYPGLGWQSAYQCLGTGATCDTGSAGLDISLVNSGVANTQFFRDAAKRGSGRYCSPDGQSYVFWIAERSGIFTDTFEWGDKSKCSTHTMPTDAYDFSL